MNYIEKLATFYVLLNGLFVIFAVIRDIKHWNTNSIIRDFRTRYQSAEDEVKEVTNLLKYTGTFTYKGEVYEIRKAAHDKEK